MFALSLILQGKHTSSIPDTPCFGLLMQYPNVRVFGWMMNMIIPHGEDRQQND